MVILISAIEALQHLDTAVAETKNHSVKESTKKNLLTHLAAYQKFCNRYLLNYFPCNQHTIVQIWAIP